MCLKRYDSANFYICTCIKPPQKRSRSAKYVYNCTIRNNKVYGNNIFMWFPFFPPEGNFQCYLMQYMQDDLELVLVWKNVSNWNVGHHKLPEEL